MFMADKFDYTLKVQADASSVSDDILKQLKTAQNEADKNKIVIDITGNKKEIEKQLSELTKEKLEIGTSLEFFFDKSAFEKEFQRLEKYSKQTGKKIGESLQSQISESFETRGLSAYIKHFFNDKDAQVTINRTKEAITDLKKQIDSFEMSGATIPDVTEHLEKYEQLKRLLLDIPKYARIQNHNFGFDFNAESIGKDLEKAYNQMGLHIKDNAKKWASELQEQYYSDMETVKTAISRAFGETAILESPQLEENVSVINNELSKTELAFKALKDEAANINLKELESKLLSLREKIEKAWDTAGKEDLSSMKEYVKLMQSFKRYGGKSSQQNQLEETYDSIDIKGKKSLSSVKTLNSELLDTESLLRKLRKESSSTIEMPVDDSAIKELEAQKKSFEELFQKYEIAQKALDDLNVKYKEQSSIISELEKKQKILQDVKNPKVIESEEYKSINSELKNTINNLNSVKEQLEYAESEIRILQRDINSFQTGDVVSIGAYENANKVIDSLSGKIDNYKKQVQQLNNVLEDQKNKNLDLSSSIENLEKTINDQKASLVENREEIQKLKTAYKELDDQQQSLMGFGDSIGAFNSAKRNVDFNEGKLKAPEEFVNFDYLDQVKRKIIEVGNEQSKLVKMAVYYNKYLESGGTEKIFGKDGEDVSQLLIDTYKRLNDLADENGRISDQSFNKNIRQNAEELRTLRSKIEVLQKENRLIKEQEKLREQAAAAEESLLKKKSVKKSSKTSKDEMSVDDIIGIISKEQQKQETETVVSGEDVVTVEKKIKLVPDVSGFKADAEDALKAVSIEKNVKLVTDTESFLSAELKSFEDIEQKVLELTNAINSKTNAITQEKIAMDVAAQGEIRSIQSIIEKIDILKKDLQGISNIILNLPHIDTKLVSKKGSEIEANFTNLVKQIQLFADGINQSGISTTISSLSNSLSVLRNIKDLGRLSIKNLDLSKLVDASNHAKQILDLAESLALLSEYLKDFNSSELNVELLKSLNVKKSNIDNMGKMAEALGKINDSLKSFDDSSKEAISSIKEIVEKASSLKDLNSIINSTSGSSSKKSKIKTSTLEEDWDAAIAEDNQRTIDAYNKLYKKAFKYYALVNKKNYGPGTLTGKETSELEKIQIEYDKATAKLLKYKTKTEEAENAYHRFVNEFERAEKLSKVNRKIATDIQKTALKSQIAAYMEKNTAATKEFGDALSDILRRIDSIQYKDELDSLNAEFLELKSNISISGKTGISFADKLKNKWRDLTAYLATYVGFQDALQLGREIFDIMVKVDDAYTEMRKVSDESIKSLKDYQRESFDIADKLSTNAIELQQSTADWMRLGESLDDAIQSAQDTSILLNVSEFTDINDATESLVAMSQAYEEFEKIEIIDKLNNIGKLPKHMVTYGNL